MEGKEMALKFYCYPNCNTCKKAKKWLEAHEIAFEDIHIVKNPPTKEELLNYMEKSDLPPKRFFNTSGKKYRELNMKDKIKEMTTEDMAGILASEGMLIKRPIVTDGSHVTVGFKEENFSEIWT